MRRWTFPLLSLLAACPAAKIEPKKEAKPDLEAHVDEAEHESIPSRVRLPPAVISAAKIRWAPLAREPLETVLELPGEISPDPDRMARVSVPLDGRIERVDFKEGDRVKKGAILAVVRVVDLPERLAALSAVSAKARAARANADRLEALAKKGLGGLQEAETARAEADALSAEAKGETERLGALGTEVDAAKASTMEVRAALPGTIVERHAVVGDRTGSDRPLATIVDLEQVWFLGRVFERDLASIRVGEKAEVELNAFPRERFEGVVEHVAEQIDPVARTVVARIRLRNQGGMLRLGLFGTARVALGQEAGKPELVVPRSAITDVENKPVVFVHHPDGDFERHDVVLGRAALGKVELISGVREGEEVVIDGVFSLKSAVLKSTFGEEEE